MKTLELVATLIGVPNNPFHESVQALTDLHIAYILALAEKRGDIKTTTKVESGSEESEEEKDKAFENAIADLDKEIDDARRG